MPYPNTQRHAVTILPFNAKAPSVQREDFPGESGDVFKNKIPYYSQYIYFPGFL